MRGAFQPASVMLVPILLVAMLSIFAEGQGLPAGPAGFSMAGEKMRFSLSAESERITGRGAGFSTVKATVDARLYDAIQDRLGIPYRANGTDDRGYDCSGFVWKVYQEAGIDLKRTSARTLWERLPEADEKDETEFGTLVFFEGLGHVGIVRDGYSFYHASTSQGVTRSFYSDYSNYWGKRIIGFRRVPLGQKRKIRPRY